MRKETETTKAGETLSERIIQNFFAGIQGGEIQQLADAAPDLLEACRKTLQVFEAMQRPPTVIVDLKLAVAKAEGK